ncbi:MAG: hypothetical protein HY721_25515 [Planctomycetes bacterium]|nr:hypothetical protein [Planctomycetota bacterium]
MKLPGRDIFTGDRHPALHPAYERCVRKLVGKVKAYKEKLRRKPERERAQQGEVREVRPAREPDVPLLERAAHEGDYAAFREGLSDYDDSLRRRVDRWTRRYPELEGLLGGDVLLSEVLEEVYLNAFEGFLRRPADRLGNWLESLIDPSVRRLLARFEEGKENLGFVEGLR